MTTIKHKYQIGLTFTRHYRKHANPETVVDIWTTTNLVGEVVKVRYVTVHDFLGQTVIDRDVTETTIARALAEP